MKECHPVNGAILYAFCLPQNRTFGRQRKSQKSTSLRDWHWHCTGILRLHLRLAFLFTANPVQSPFSQSPVGPRCTFDRADDLSQCQTWPATILFRQRSIIRCSIQVLTTAREMAHSEIARLGPTWVRLLPSCRFESAINASADSKRRKTN